MGLAALLLLTQDVADLIRGLGSDSPEQREQSVRELAGLGEAARKSLVEAASSSDQEAATRAQKLLHRLDLRAGLSRELQSSRPQLADELAFGEYKNWYEALSQTEHVPGDLAILALGAARLCPNESERIRVLERIMKLGPRHAPAAVLKLSEDTSPGVRSAAAPALVDCSTESANARILNLLTDAEASVRRAALRAIQYGSIRKAAITTLQKLEDDPDSTVRALACIALVDESATIRNPAKATESIVLALAAGEQFWGEIRALKSLGTDAISKLIGLLGHGSAEVRKVAVRALDELQAAESLDHILKLFRDDEPQVRDAARSVLGRPWAHGSVPALIQMLHEPESRTAAMSALAFQNAKSSSDAVATFLGHSDPHTRAQSAQVLGMLGAVESSRGLRLLLKDEEVTVRRSAAWALGTLGIEEAVDDLSPLAKDKLPEVRISAALALKKLGTPQAVRMLLVLVSDSDEEVAAVAAYSLGVLRRKEAAPEIRRLLKKGHFKYVYAEALGRLGDQEAESELQKLLGGDHEGPAIRALGELRCQSAADRIMSRLDHRGYHIRRECVVAIGKLKYGPAMGHLRSRLDDLDDGVQKCAEWALGRIGTREAMVALKDRLARAGSERRVFSYWAVDWPRDVVGNETCSIDRPYCFSPQLLGALCRGDERAAVLNRLLEGLKSSMEPVQVDAARRLGRLGFGEAAREVEKLLRHSSRSVQEGAAAGLCGLGVRDGARPLVESSGPYTDLNGLRKPDLWRRLNGHILDSEFEETAQDAWREIEGALGIRIDGSSCNVDARRFVKVPPGLNVIDALEFMLKDGEIILEEDAIRLVPRSDARRFWLEWLK
jgi:HEAT repeat protein